MQKILSLLAALIICSNSFGQIITTIAGTGVANYSGDGGPAIFAGMDLPVNIFITHSGNILIIDANNHCIRQINNAGIISTIAGTGTHGYSGDGGPASAAQLYFPYSVAEDSSGNLYIADAANNRIRKIDTSGIITTFAGTGAAGHAGDGGSATSAQINGPSGITIDALGNIYIADTYNDCIRKINAAGIISTIAGTGAAGYSGDGSPATNAQINHPARVIIDSIGSIYFSDFVNSAVRKIDTSGIITTIAGTGMPDYSGDNGPATAAALNQPCGLAIDKNGAMYIADAFNNRIRKVTPSGIISTIAGTGAYGFGGDGGNALDALLYGPDGIAFDANGNLLLTDADNNRVRKIIYNVAVDDINGIESDIIVYPNPAKNRVFFNFSLSSRTIIRLMDITGQIKKELLVHAQRSASIDIMDLSRGMYLYEVINDKGSTTGKIVVE